MTQSKPSRTVAYSGVAPIRGGSVKIGSLGQKRVGANTKEVKPEFLRAIRVMSIVGEHALIASTHVKSSSERLLITRPQSFLRIITPRVSRILAKRIEH